MSKVAIKAENIAKAYQLGQIGTGTISRDIERWYARMRGKEDPFLRIGESNNQNTKGTSDVVWSLKDINFEIEQGDAVAIIGRNGAGKSTLLKILSKVTAPTTGKISGKGRIASLLEVGTGFHPELSGRENIFLNGAILGMRKKEIQRKLEEIVDFAGIERYLDTPVKRYSSGMYVRLAFAVAAHLESEILIVDEVLAVGDAEFQKKCLGKMGEVSKGEGRTVLFVSHNMESILKLCHNGILLKNGQLISYDSSSKICEEYIMQNEQIQRSKIIENHNLNEFLKVNLLLIDKVNYNQFDEVNFEIELESNIQNKLDCIALIIMDSFGNRIAILDLRSKELLEYSIISKKIKIKGKAYNIGIMPGDYSIGLAIGSQNCTGDFLNLIGFQVISNSIKENEFLPFAKNVSGNLAIEFDFNTNYG
ncbi:MULTISPECIES: ABC transporter ATP-binding protein [unclassified Pedobacter]|uniref:ABC transporter ATP-binding protein n=1 Tax=unclassified Pedobacter TaxID=2628915 RepID=UPI00181EE2FA|nr:MULTISPECIES: ABC transporter ATP-binding protein [unclassified Pedobacter]NII81336.1 lipopolysaccharide transport system ATP-binding protein [Pedobacter sp. SG908]NMN35342.1 lipopolysaccharide transport system ATP-binding protein [Pedobacter sp. SG918]